MINYLFHRCLREIPVILLLNKQDMLAKKIKDGFSIETYFREYYGNRSPTEESGKNTSLSIVISLLSKQ
jgi:hypothetical protein